MRVSGTIDFIEVDKLKPILFEIFGETDLKFRIRILGEEFSIINEEFELWIETIDPLGEMQMKLPSYMVDWGFNKSLEESLKDLNFFTQKLDSKKVSYRLAFYPIEGDESVEIELRSIGYYDEYERMKKK